MKNIVCTVPYEGEASDGMNGTTENLQSCNAGRKEVLRQQQHIFFSQGKIDAAGDCWRRHRTFFHSFKFLNSLLILLRELVIIVIKLWDVSNLFIFFLITKSHDLSSGRVGRGFLWFVISENCCGSSKVQAEEVFWAKDVTSKLKFLNGDGEEDGKKRHNNNNLINGPSLMSDDSDEGPKYLFNKHNFLDLLFWLRLERYSRPLCGVCDALAQFIIIIIFCLMKHFRVRSRAHRLSVCFSNSRQERKKKKEKTPRTKHEKIYNSQLFLAEERSHHVSS